MTTGPGARLLRSQGTDDRGVKVLVAGEGGSSCSATYPVSTAVTLTAAAGSNAVFKSWGGACGGTTPTCTVTLDAAKSVTATFSRMFTEGAGADSAIAGGSVTIKAVHITELRSAIDTLRAVYGLAVFDWSDPILSPGVTPARGVHFSELRTALSPAYQAASQAVPTFTDPTITPGVTPIKAAHLNDLRQAVRLLE